jgi:hypothetical protein
MELLQESLGIVPFLIQIDGDDGESLALVRILHRLHPGKGLTAWRAPGRPEIQIDHAAVKAIQIERGTAAGYCGRQCACARHE